MAAAVMWAMVGPTVDITDAFKTINPASDHAVQPP